MTRISILVPMRNAEAYIASTLGSLLGQAGLDRERDEIVIVDDGSTDRSREVVEQLERQTPRGARVRVIDGPRQGISAAMNAALSEARGEYLCRCDADDLYPPGRLERQLRWLAARPEFGAVCGSFSTITAKGRPIADFACGDAEQEITGELRSGKTRTHFCTFLSRAGSVRKAGGFRPWFVTAEDIDLQLRLGEVCRVGFEPVGAYLYRLHDASITHQQADARRVFYESSARAFSEQRRATGADDLERGSPPAPPAVDDGSAAPRSSSEQAQAVLIGASWRQHKDGRRTKAVATGFRACLTRPTSIGAWKNLCTLVFKRA
jgi:glycosyltransferase involved in cell wall biosynthesis